MLVSSLGELAVTQGLIPESERQRLAEELRKAVGEGAPQSFARLLIRHGHAPDAVSRLLAGGQSVEQVRCDACGAARPSAELPDRAEVPCVCGSMLLGFIPFAGDEPRHPTDRYPTVLPLPSAPRGTVRYDKVHELPDDPPPPSDNDATGPYRRILPLPDQVADDRFQALLAAPLELPPEDPAEAADIGQMTLSPEELARLKGEEGGSGQMTLSEAEYDELVASGALPKIRAEAEAARAAATPAAEPPAPATQPSLGPLIAIAALLLVALLAAVVALVMP